MFRPGAQSFLAVSQALGLSLYPISSLVPLQFYSSKGSWPPSWVWSSLSAVTRPLLLPSSTFWGASKGLSEILVPRMQCGLAHSRCPAGALHALTTTLAVRCWDPHFPDVETEALRHLAVCLSSHGSSRGWSSPLGRMPLHGGFCL